MNAVFYIDEKKDKILWTWKDANMISKFVLKRCTKVDEVEATCFREAVAHAKELEGKLCRTC